MPIEFDEMAGENEFEKSLIEASEICEKIGEILAPIAESAQKKYSERKDAGSREVRVETCLKFFNDIFLKEYDSFAASGLFKKVDQLFTSLLECWKVFAIPSKIEDLATSIKISQERDPATLTQLRHSKERNEGMMDRDKVIASFLSFCKRNDYEPQFFKVDKSEIAEIERRQKEDKKSARRLLDIAGKRQTFVETTL
jgi:hypothetical protein